MMTCPWVKHFNIIDMIIAVATVLEHKGKHPQILLHECPYDL